MKLWLRFDLLLVFTSSDTFNQLIGFPEPPGDYAINGDV